MLSNKITNYKSLYLPEQHPFRLVNPSPWPFVVPCSVFPLVLGLIFVLHLNKNKNTFSFNQQMYLLQINTVPYLPIVLWSLVLLLLGYILFNLFGLLWLCNMRKVEIPLKLRVFSQTNLCFSPFLLLNDTSSLSLVYFATFVGVIYLIFFAGFWSADKFLPIDNVDLKFVVSICFGLLLGVEALYLSSFLINEVNGWTPFGWGLLILASFLAVCSAVFKNFRTILWNSIILLLDAFFDSVETTAKFKLELKPHVLVDLGFVVFYVLLTSAIAVLVRACYLNPDTFQLVLLTAFTVEITFLCYLRWIKKDYSLAFYLNHCFNMVIRFGVLVSLLWGFLIVLIVMFFSYTLWCFVEGYAKYSLQLVKYSEIYQKALPEIEGYSPFKRFKIKSTGLAVYSFPSFLTDGASFLTFGFGFATSLNAWYWFSHLVDSNSPFAVLGNRYFFRTSLVYCGMYLFTFTTLYILWNQVNLLNNSKKAEKSSLAWLLNIIGKDPIFAIIGNPGSAVQSAIRKHCITYIYGAGALAGGTVIVGGGVIVYNGMRDFCISHSSERTMDALEHRLGRKLSPSEMFKVIHDKSISYGKPVSNKMPYIDVDTVKTLVDNLSSKVKKSSPYEETRLTYANVRDFVEGAMGVEGKKTIDTPKPPKPRLE